MCFTLSRKTVFSCTFPGGAPCLEKRNLAETGSRPQHGTDLGLLTQRNPELAAMLFCELLGRFCVFVGVGYLQWHVGALRSEESV